MPTVRGWVSASVCAATIALAEPASAGGSLNVTLLSNLNDHNGYADVWGFEKDGVYLAILCAREGTAFINVTDPENPIELLFLPGPVSIWRDAKTHDDYCYIVTDVGGAGLQIVNLSNPLLPLPEPAFTAAFATAHNVFIDEEAAVLYAVGTGYPTSNCSYMLDVSDPVNPVTLGCFDDFYIHDIYVEDGKAYAASVYDGFMATLDVTDPPNFTELGRHTTSSSAAHNTWLTVDGQHCLTSDEVDTGHLDIYDVTEPEFPVRVGEWFNPDEPGSSIHNVLVRGRFAYCSWYTAGVQILDIDDPTSPTRVAYYDTHSATSGFTGAWGVYPWGEGDTFYVSDIETGLYVFRFDNPIVGTEASTPLVFNTAMHLARPNPFRRAATLGFELARGGRATLDVFDASGRRVERLLDGTFAAGPHETSWDGRLDDGTIAAPGTYFIRLSTPSQSTATKIVRTE